MLKLDFEVKSYFLFILTLLVTMPSKESNNFPISVTEILYSPILFIKILDIYVYVYIHFILFYTRSKLRINFKRLQKF